LSLAEFAYNNAHQDSIKTSLFFANYRYHSCFNSEIHLSLIISISVSTKKHVKHFQKLHNELVKTVKSLQNIQVKYYNMKHKRVEFNIRDKVWLSTRNTRTERKMKKLDWKRIRLYRILTRVGTQVYRLELPLSLRIHLTFYISLLEEYYENRLSGHIASPPPPILIDIHSEYKVEKVLDVKYQRNYLYYLVKWKNYLLLKNSWKPATNLQNASELLQEFYTKNPLKPH